MATIGVVGPGDSALPEHLVAALEIGRLLGRDGHAVVNGGLGGVMTAVSEGAREAGGLVLGLLPGHDRAAANDFVTVAVPTGLGELRNALVVRASDAVIAVGASWGTVSEIALAVRTGVPVVWLHGLELPLRGPVAVHTPAAAVASAVALAHRRRTRG